MSAAGQREGGGGMRVAVELKQRLRALELQGRLSGVIELVPVANPIGLGQMLQAAPKPSSQLPW